MPSLGVLGYHSKQLFGTIKLLDFFFLMEGGIHNTITQMSNLN